MFIVVLLLMVLMLTLFILVVDVDVVGDNLRFLVVVVYENQRVPPGNNCR